MSVYSAHEPLPRDIPIVQVGLVDNDLAKNFAAEIALKADVRETLRVLVPAIESAGGPSLAKLASDRIESLKQRNWSTNRHRLEREILQKNGAIPIDPDWIALQVISSLPPNAILVDEGLTSSRYMSALRAHHDRYGYHWRHRLGPTGIRRRQFCKSRKTRSLLLGRRKCDVFDPIPLDGRAPCGVSKASRRAKKNVPNRVGS
jgi:thiamine pyrophosphate-dependent acetolactate synthase large subunit-like protein